MKKFEIWSCERKQLNVKLVVNKNVDIVLNCRY